MADPVLPWVVGVGSGSGFVGVLCAHPFDLAPTGTQGLVLVSALAIGPMGAWRARDVGGRAAGIAVLSAAIVGTAYATLLVFFPGYPAVGPSEALAFRLMLFPYLLTLLVGMSRAAQLSDRAVLATVAVLGLLASDITLPNDPVSRCLPVTFATRHGQIYPPLYGFWTKGSIRMAMTVSEADRLGLCLPAPESDDPYTTIRSWSVDVSHTVEGCTFDVQYREGWLTADIFCGFT